MNSIIKVIRGTKMFSGIRSVHGIAWNLKQPVFSKENAAEKKLEAETLRNKLSIELARNHVIWSERRSTSFTDEIDVIKKRKCNIRSNPMWLSYLSRNVC